jgi:hypothetical protein
MESLLKNGLESCDSIITPNLEEDCVGLAGEPDAGLASRTNFDEFADERHLKRSLDVVRLCESGFQEASVRETKKSNNFAKAKQHCRLQPNRNQQERL